MRRNEGLARVAAVNFASVIYSWMDGKRAPDVGLLIERGLVRQDYVRARPELSYTPENGASSEWGSLANPRSLIDNLPGLVSEEEIRAYEIATPADRLLPHFVRIESNGPGLLARIEMSNASVSWNASNPTRTLPNPGGRFQVWNGSDDGGPGFTPLSFALAEENDTLAGSDNLGMFGNLFFAGELDTSYRWDLALAKGELSVLLDAERLKHIEEDPEKIGGSSEYHGVAVIDEAKLKERLPHLVSPEGDCGKTMHDGVEIGCLNSWTYDGSPRAYHALSGGYWLNAGALDVMKVLVEKAKAGEFEPIDGDGTQEISIAFPGESWHRKTLLATFEKVLHSMTLNNLRMATIIQRAFGEEALESGSLQATSRTFFGRTLPGLAGGKLDLVDGRPSHNIYGNGVVGRIPEASADGSPLRALLERTRSASAAFSTRHGDDDTHAMHRIVLRWDGSGRANRKP